MNLFVYTGASNLAQAVVNSASDLTPVSPNPGLIFGDTEPLTLKFVSASGVFESWTLAAGYSVVVSLGEPNTDGSGAYVQTSNFADVTNGFSGALQLNTQSLAGALNNKRGSSPTASFTLHIRVTSPDGVTQTYARQLVTLAAAVSVALTPDSTPVNFANFADVQAAKTEAAASASAANVSAGNSATSATNAAASAVNASASAGAAYTDRVIAGNSATTAAGHASTAQTAATNAAGSALTATSGAGTATAAAAAATLSESNAAASAASAAASQTGAATSATTAGTAATNAQASATNANNSAVAAAASAATASAVSGSGNGTFANANLTGVSSVAAGSGVSLALNGGSSGATVTLGQGANGSVTVTPKGTGSATINGSSVLLSPASRVRIHPTGGSAAVLDWYRADAEKFQTYIDSSDNFIIRDSTAGATVASFKSSTGATLKGTTTNDNAATGYVGEYASSTLAEGAAVALTTATSANVTSVSLTAGDWDVSAVIGFNNTPTGGTVTEASLGSTSATLNATLGSYLKTPTIQSATSQLVLAVPSIRVSVASTTTIYLVARQTFSGGASGSFGAIRARRVR